MTPRLLLTWFTGGLWFGLVEGVSSLRLHATAVGPFSERLLSLTISMVLDGTALAVVAGLLLWPSRLASRVAKLPIGPTHISLVLLTWLVSMGLVVLQAAHSEAIVTSVLPPFLLIIGGALLVSVGAGLIAAGGGLGSGLDMARRPRGWVTLALCVLLAASVGWSRTVADTDDSRPNVVLVSLDTLRADHLGYHGYARNTSPNIDALARRSIVFKNARAPSHWTLPSHASMLTGLDPGSLGVLGGYDILDPGHVTIAERLGAAGYRTAAFVGNDPRSFIGALRGLDQGFDEYHHPHYPHPALVGVLPRLLNKLVWEYFDHQVGTAATQMAHVENWLWRHHEERFFLFVHLFDIHSDIWRLPYEAPDPFLHRFTRSIDGYSGCGPNGRCASRLLLDYASGLLAPPNADTIRHMIDLYDGGISYTDHQVARLFAALHTLGIDDDTAVIVTSDHGEAFFEHRKPLHNDLHRENLHIPLIISMPDGRLAGSQVEELVSIVDIAPTIFELAGLEPGTDRTRSLLSRLHPSGAVQSRAREAGTVAIGTDSASIETRWWKYIRDWDSEEPSVGAAANELLFDVQADPAEARDLAADRPSDLSALRAALNTALERSLDFQRRMGDDIDRAIEITPAELKRLRALGYIR